MRCTAFCFAFVCLIMGTSLPLLHSQERISTPPVVASIWDYAGTIQVVTAGVDLDYDEQLDDGDEPASWLIIDPATRSVIRSMQFPWSDITAKHLGFDPNLGIVYIALDDTVWAYTAMTQQRSSTPVFVGSNITSVAYNLSNANICISHRPSYSDPGYISIIDPVAGTTTEVDVAVNPQMLAYYRLGATATPIVLCEGTFGNADGSLVFVDADNTTTEVVLGDTPNNLVVDDARGLVYVTMTGSHEIVVVDIPARRVVGRYPTPTSGYDGPREIAIHDDYAFVTTYAGTVLMFNRGVSGGDPIMTLQRTFTVGDKCDPVHVAFDHVWVGATYAGTSYDPASDVIVFPLGTVSVDDELHVHVSWGPASTAVDLRGQRMALTVHDGAIDLSRLAPGFYLVTDGVNTRTVVVP